MSDRLFTWLDVNQRLRQYFDKNSIEAPTLLRRRSFRAYWDGLRITTPTGTNESELIHQLEEVFLASFDEKKMAIILGQAPTSELPIIFETEDDSKYIPKEMFSPEFGPARYIGETQPFANDRKPEGDEPTLIAFHSFKGGVGRTLHTVALALQLSKEGKKVLLIDADFEAPGISWYFEQADISFSDFIAMAHGDSTPKFEYTLSNSATILQNSSYENIFILPAFRDTSNFGEPIIKPEHLINASNPFLLQDLVVDLGKKIGADYILLDLRAGLSELSSGWLLDPKVFKVYVTTLSGQSLRGCQNLLERTASIYDKYALDKQSDAFLPFIIFSQTPIGTVENSAKAIWDGNVEEGYGEWRDLAELKKTYEYLIPSINADNYPIWIENVCFSSENNALKILPHQWDELTHIVRDSGVLDKIRPLREWLPNRPAQLGLTQPIRNENEETTSLDDLRKALGSTAHNLVFAENVSLSKSDLLITQSIENLANRNVANVPIVVIVGAKGSGKTYLYRYINGFATWHEFISQVRGQANGGPEAEICKATSPNSQNNEITIRVQDLIKDWLAHETWSETQWRDKWLDIISWISGVKPFGKANTGQEFAKSNSKKLVFLFDGLEEIFLEYHNKDSHKTALRALLQGVPNWLETLPGKNIGAVIFIRQDIVSYAIPQNTGQFLSRYQDYQLKWNEEEALRLAHWIAKKANVLRDSKDSIKMERAELETALYQIWGQRLGQDNAREAKSAGWILDALSNLQNEVQSRDIVRFLYFAADGSGTDSTKKSYPDRLLTPSSIRKSVGKVGFEKLEELKTENGLLYEILVKIQNSGLKFPCSKKGLDFLTSEERDMMEKNGALREYRNEYYLAEIWRRGLDIGYSKVGRPRIQW